MAGGGCSAGVVPVIGVRDAEKGYGVGKNREVVLCKLNMTVKKGVMYVFLKSFLYYHVNYCVAFVFVCVDMVCLVLAVAARRLC